MSATAPMRSRKSRCPWAEGAVALQSRHAGGAARHVLTPHDRIRRSELLPGILKVPCLARLLVPAGLAALLALSSCRLLDPNPGPSPVRGGGGGIPVPSDTTVSLSKGGTVYGLLCARCHGDSAAGSAFAPGIQAATGIVGITRQGKGSMPAFPSVTGPDAASIEIFLAHFIQTSPSDGAALFKGLCARCHGDSARGGSGPGLKGVSGILSVVRGGRGKMPAFPTLSTPQVLAIEAFLLGLAPRGADTLFNGGVIFAKHCARCHGDSAEGGAGPNIRGNTGIRAVVLRGFLRRMPAFSWFSQSQINALESFLAHFPVDGGDLKPAHARTSFFQPKPASRFDLTPAPGVDRVTRIPPGGPHPSREAVRPNLPIRRIQGPWQRRPSVSA